MSKLEEKIDAIMEALEFILEKDGEMARAMDLYRVRSNYNPEDE